MSTPRVNERCNPEPPHTCFGYEHPSPLSTFYDPETDPDLKTPHEKQEQFQLWVSSFFDHPNPDSGDLATTKTCGRDATVTKWSEEELEWYFNEEVVIRCEIPM